MGQAQKRPIRPCVIHDLTQGEVDDLMAMLRRNLCRGVRKGAVPLKSTPAMIRSAN